RAHDPVPAAAQHSVGDPTAPGILVDQQDASEAPGPGNPSALGPDRLGAHSSSSPEPCRRTLDGSGFPDRGGSRDAAVPQKATKGPEPTASGAYSGVRMVTLVQKT